MATPCYYCNLRMELFTRFLLDAKAGQKLLITKREDGCIICEEAHANPPVYRQPQKLVKISDLTYYECEAIMMKAKERQHS